MKRDKSSTFLLALLSLVISQLAVADEQKPKLELLKPGEIAPAWTLSRPDGKALSLEDLRGNGVVLVYWATWCPYCKKLFPGIQKLIDTHQGKPLRVIGLNFKDDEDTEAYKQKHGFTFEVVLNADGIAKSYGTKGTPTVFVLDADGKITYVTTKSNPDNSALADAVAAVVADAESRLKANDS